MSEDAKNAPTSPQAWAKIEADYRAGIKSLRQIGSDHGVTEGAIRKRAKKEDWERDLGEKVRAKAEALVRKEAVRKEVRETNRVPEADIIEANALGVATVMLSQRSDIQRSRSLAMRLLGELEQVTDHGDTLEAIADMLLDPNGDENLDDNAAKARRQRMMDSLNKAISLNGRVDNIKKLTDTLKTLVGLEREAYGIGADDGKSKGYEDLLDDL